MHALSAEELLNIWECGSAQTPAERALALLACACPESSADDLARLPIGRRDGLLLNLRELTFGSQLTSTIVCPRCGERLETAFRVGDVREPTADSVPRDSFELVAREFELSYRLPNSLDLSSVDPRNDVGEARRRLLDHCVLSARRGHEAVRLDDVPESVVTALIDRMAEDDPQANVEIDVTCAGCGCQWQAPFDVLSFFWTELSAWAQRLVREVHVLASAYGWREAEILALSPQRRQTYIELIAS